MTPPYRLGVYESARQIRTGALSPVTLAEALLERIDTLEPALQAWVTIDREQVLADARERENEAEQGRFRGPLHGVPVGIKDIFYTEGMATTACSRILADFVPYYDAPCVAKLKQAGAIVLGKTVTTEFAASDPPPTLNPWNFAHTPGGSSSGSSVAVSTGMCAAALGSQTAGSVCRPASFNGVVGLKPSYGRISRRGVVAYSWSLDTVGVMSRNVADAAVMLQAMAGYDPQDDGSVEQPVPDYLAQMDGLDRPPRIGIIRDFFYDRSTVEVREHTDAAVEKLAAAGAEIVEIDLPASFATVHACQSVVSNVEAAAFHEEYFRERADEYGPGVRSSIELGMLIPALDYVQAQRLRREFRRDMIAALASVDAALMPTTTSPAPADLSTTGDPVFQVPWTSAGLPSITLPSGLGASGLPLGVQLAGQPFAEGSLLAVARWCESVLDVQLWPPDYA